ncbi:MAG: polyribonucleotide nucleotidyltransferase, partial [Rhodospirillales bacterium]
MEESIQNMFKEFRKEIEWGGRKLVLESGKIARQADGAVMATYGETKVLCTVVAEKTQRPGIDFFPLAVHYGEKAYAAGKIPGGFFKREGRPGEKETLTCRLIDRPIRPLFAKSFRNETQVICTVMSHDQENNPDIVAMIGTSAALTLSGLPFMGPIGGCRVGYINDEFVLNPQTDELAESKLDLVVAGTTEGVLMVESEVQELSEEVMLNAVMFAHRSFQPVIQAIIEMAEACAKEPRQLPEPLEGKQALVDKVASLAEEGLRAAYAEKDKMIRQGKVSEVRDTVNAAIKDDDSFDSELVENVLADAFKSVEKDIVRRDILKTGQRIDGRDTRTVRPIVS